MDIHLKSATERQLVNELIRRNELAYSSSNPSWEKRRRARWLLNEVGHIICEWDGMQEPIAHDGND